MSAKLDEFKEFVKRHPLLKGMVQSKQKTWQELYEDYCILGESAFEDSKEEAKEEPKKENKSSSSTEDLIKTVVGYVKKLIQIK